MKLFPRHEKIIDAIGRNGSCCPNVLWQASGVIRIERAIPELKKKGLVVWTTKRNFGKLFVNNRPPGWTLTDKGWKIYKEREAKRIAELKALLAKDK